MLVLLFSWGRSLSYDHFFLLAGASSLNATGTRVGTLCPIERPPGWVSHLLELTWEIEEDLKFEGVWEVGSLLRSSSLVSVQEFA